jgi:hypothetical protein
MVDDVLSISLLAHFLLGAWQIPLAGGVGGSGGNNN